MKYTQSTFNGDVTFLKIAKCSETQNEAFSYKNPLKLIKAPENATLFWVQETFIKFWSLKYLIVKSKQPCSRQLETGLPVFWSHTDGLVVNVNHHVTFMWYHLVVWVILSPKNPSEWNNASRSSKGVTWLVTFGRAKSTIGTNSPVTKTGTIGLNQSLR